MGKYIHSFTAIRTKEQTIEEDDVKQNGIDASCPFLHLYHSVLHNPLNASVFLADMRDQRRNRSLWQRNFCL